MPQAIHPRPSEAINQALAVAKLQTRKALGIAGNRSAWRCLWCKQNRRGEAHDASRAPIYRLVHLKASVRPCPILKEGPEGASWRSNAKTEMQVGRNQSPVLTKSEPALRFFV
jgi:hypothetical protein